MFGVFVPKYVSDTFFNFEHVMELFVGFATSYIFLIRKQPPDLFYKKDVLKNFVKFTGKRLLQASARNSIKKRDSGTSIFLWIL